MRRVRKKPIDTYALTKLLSEEICFAYGREYGLPATALRYCSIKAANEVLGMLQTGLAELLH